MATTSQGAYPSTKDGLLQRIHSMVELGTISSNTQSIEVALIEELNFESIRRKLINKIGSDYAGVIGVKAPDTPDTEVVDNTFVE